MDVVLQQVRDRVSVKNSKQITTLTQDITLRIDPSQWEMEYSWKKRENKLSPSYESQSYEVAPSYGNQVVLRTPEVAEYKRNLQHTKPLVTKAAADAGYSAELVSCWLWCTGN